MRAPDDFHRNRPRIARWLSNKGRAVEGATMIYSESAGRVEIDGEMTTIDEPYAGSIVTCAEAGDDPAGFDSAGGVA
jgi:hypothetical protein